MFERLKSIIGVYPVTIGKIPTYFLILGIIISIAGLIVNHVHFMHSWLVSFMFYLSICLGAFFLVLLHYLLDSQWIVPVRRLAEHLACLLPFMFILFLPIAFWSLSQYEFEVHPDAEGHISKQNTKLENAENKASSVNKENSNFDDQQSVTEDKNYARDDHQSSVKVFYNWMRSETEYYNDKKELKNKLLKENPDLDIAVLEEKLYQMPVHDHAWYAKKGYLNKTSWTIRWIFCFISWGLITWFIRKFSLAQDKDGKAKWTSYNRKIAAGGIFVFAVTLTLAAFDGMKGLEHQWFSTMYGVYYFAGSFWVSLITIYVVTLYLKSTGPLRDIVRKETFKDLGTLFFAFTVFYSYIHFSQYFLIWNAAIPEETFWYVKREQGPWWNVGMIILFGHFFIPFLTLLRQDVKTKPTAMILMAIIGWMVHFCDMSYNVMPLIHETSGWTKFIWIDLGCILFMGGFLSIIFIYFFKMHSPYPLKDPRIAETMGVYVKLKSEA